MAFLKRVDIDAAQDIKYVEMEVPEWGGTVLLKSMSCADRDAFAESVWSGEGAARKQNWTGSRERLVALALVDAETRQPMYSINEVGILAQRSADALQRVFDRVQELNGLVSAAVIEAKNVSGGDPTADSTSA